MKISIPMKKSGPVLVSGFPGVGKSHLARSAEFTIADSDSSKFDKVFFPDNYITHIKDLMLNQDLDYIMVSTHEEVRDALVAEGITFLLVYPDISLKEEYRQRYVGRNSPQAFIDRIISEWDSMINSCVMQSGCQHVVLESGQYLTDSLLQSQIPATCGDIKCLDTVPILKWLQNDKVKKCICSGCIRERKNLGGYQPCSKNRKIHKPPKDD